MILRVECLAPNVEGITWDVFVTPPWMSILTTRIIQIFDHGDLELPSLKLTANAPENQWLEDEIPFGMAYFQR